MFQVHGKIAMGFKLEVQPTKLLQEEVITVQTDTKMLANQSKGAVNQEVKPLNADESKFQAEEKGAR